MAAAIYGDGFQAKVEGGEMAGGGDAGLLKLTTTPTACKQEEYRGQCARPGLHVAALKHKLPLLYVAAWQYGATIWMGRRDDQDDEIGGRDLAKMDCESVRCKGGIF